MLIQDNPVVDETEPKFHIDHTGACFVRWTERRADGGLVDCAAQVKLIAPHIVRVRRPQKDDGER